MELKHFNAFIRIPESQYCDLHQNLEVNASNRDEALRYFNQFLEHSDHSVRMHDYDIIATDLPTQRTKDLPAGIVTQVLAMRCTKGRIHLTPNGITAIPLKLRAPPRS